MFGGQSNQPGQFGSTTPSFGSGFAGFGQRTQSSFNTSAFASPTTTQAVAPSFGTPTFGGGSVTTAFATPAFGSTQPTGTTFGQQQQQPQQQASNPFASGSGAFGAQPTSTAFGTSQPSTFGTGSAFGGTQSTSLFGNTAPQTSSTGGFGGSQLGSFGSTQSSAFGTGTGSWFSSGQQPQQQQQQQPQSTSFSGFGSGGGGLFSQPKIGFSFSTNFGM